MRKLQKEFEPEMYTEDGITKEEFYDNSFGLSYEEQEMQKVLLRSYQKNK